MGLIYVLVTATLVFIFIYNKVFDGNKFIKELSPIFRNIIEDDYEFLVRLRYEDEDVDLEEMFEKRIRNAVLTFLIVLFLSILAGKFAFIVIFLAVVLALLVFKMPYAKLKRMYKAHLHNIDLLLPYYVKGLEILVQHYTVPIALSRSIETAPEVFKRGLLKLVAKIDAGDSSIKPYTDFAEEYPVRDSMRMMRLLYRLSLGSQDNKQEQVMAFSRMVSTLQNKAREIKYQERLDKMEKKTMIMLFATGGGVMLLLFMSMTLMMNF
jgi:hypothetical protein